MRGVGCFEGSKTTKPKLSFDSFGLCLRVPPSLWPDAYTLWAARSGYGTPSCGASQALADLYEACGDLFVS